MNACYKQILKIKNMQRILKTDELWQRLASCLCLIVFKNNGYLNTLMMLDPQTAISYYTTYLKPQLCINIIQTMVHSVTYPVYVGTVFTYIYVHILMQNRSDRYLTCAFAGAISNDMRY